MWPYGKISDVVLDTDRKLCFVGAGGGVFTVKMANPNYPVLLYESIRLDQKIKHLIYSQDGEFLLVFEGSDTLRAYDVSQSGQPQWLSNIWVYNGGTELVYNELTHKAYSCWLNDVFSINYSDPTAPYGDDIYHRSYITLYYDICTDRAFVVAAFTDSTGVTGATFLRASDLSFMFEFRVDPGIKSMALKGDASAFYASYASGTDTALVAYQIYSNHLTETQRIPLHGRASNLAVYGNLLYAMVGDSVFQVFSLADPFHPQPLGLMYMPHQNRGKICPGNGMCAVMMPGYILWTVDMTNPSSPKMAGSFLPPGDNPLRMHVDREYIITTAYYYDYFQDQAIGCLFTLERTPELHYCNCISVEGRPMDLEARGNYLLVSVERDSVGYLQVYDISNPALPLLLSESCVGSYGLLHIEGNAAAIANRKLETAILDISDIVHPVVASEIPFPAKRAYIHDGRAYLSNLYARIYDVSDPYNPLYQDSMNVGDHNMVTAWDHYVYPIKGGYFYIYDVSDPYDVKFLRLIHDERIGDAGTMSGQRLLLSLRGDLVVYDVTQPTNPFCYAYYNHLPYNIGTSDYLVARGDTVFVATGGLGIIVYEIYAQPPSVNEGEDSDLLRAWYSDGKLYLETPPDLPVQVSVYDISGRRILQLPERKYGPGPCEIPIELASGIYLALVRAGSMVQCITIPCVK